MPGKTKPPVSQILHSDDGPRIMVRASTLAEALETAHDEAAGEDLVVCDPESVRLEWIRAIPCAPRSSGGHELDGWWCEGDFRCHYVPGKPGPGAFRGAFADLNYADEFEDDDPVKAPYLAAVAAMEARALPGKETGDVQAH